ncbi:MAG: hypothetical protein LBE78_06530 [Burkholderiaceae bacterium]|nr:hypothetical protein [Burkholderiaceae bacterium]
MLDLKSAKWEALMWVQSEKKVARRVFEAALNAEKAELVTEFKARAMAVTQPDDIRLIEQYLRDKRYEIDRKYDSRCSQLIRVLARLLSEGRIHEDQLIGLADEKRAWICHLASL